MHETPSQIREAVFSDGFWRFEIIFILSSKVFSMAWVDERLDWLQQVPLLQ